MEKLKNSLIKLLTDNARYSFKELSLMLGVDETTIQRAIEEMENDGIIVKYALIVNAEKLPEEKVEALIEIKVVPQKLKGFEAIADEICRFKEVKSLYLMSGGFDLAVFVEGKSITDVSKIVSEKLAVIDGVLGLQTHFILKKYKIEGQMTKKEEDKRELI
ncbi:MAG: Lrp/AsnC family transcriptional regulator [Clostridiales bacterium]|nr:Lrp/AsnC family transcriptional regulator [Clostridiales bacterium]